MLQKQYRLKKYSASDINICIYFGKEKNQTDIPTKIAFVVSKKVHKRAVVRNYIKRLMRESFRQILKENNNIYNIHKYISIICTAKTASINADFTVIDNSIRTLLLKHQ